MARGQSGRCQLHGSTQSRPSPASAQDRKADTWQDVGSADEQHQKFGTRRQNLRACIPKRLADPRVRCLLRVGTGLLVPVGFDRPSHSFLVAGTGRSVDDISSVRRAGPRPLRIDLRFRFGDVAWHGDRAGAARRRMRSVPRLSRSATTGTHMSASSTWWFTALRLAQIWLRSGRRFTPCTNKPSSLSGRSHLSSPALRCLLLTRWPNGFRYLGGGELFSLWWKRYCFGMSR